jgi:hypothetical protein
MRTRTGIAMLAVGAVMLFVGHGRLQLCGLLVVLTGAAGLWVARLRPGWGRRGAEQVGSWLTPPDAGLADADRVPLAVMLDEPADPPRPQPDPDPDIRS